MSIDWQLNKIPIFKVSELMQSIRVSVNRLGFSQIYNPSIYVSVSNRLVWRRVQDHSIGPCYVLKNLLYNIGISHLHNLVSFLTAEPTSSSNKIHHTTIPIGIYHVFQVRKSIFITTTIFKHWVTIIMKDIAKHLFMEIIIIKRTHSSY